ncbi:PorV/PorQ family protein [candidate division KSB1 bacterium]|nr:PorV/PorQ family protein [candidate division KSB1 bacterium]
MKTWIRTLFLCVLLCTSLVRAQGSVGWGGVNDIFDLPVGANALAMGGANVAAANDPFALYWNPAALEQVQQMSLGLYLQNLPYGGQYNYIAFAYPSLFRGSVSFGMLRLASDDIENRGVDDATLLGTLNYSRTLFMLGYGLRLFNWLSVGSTLKFERAVFPGPEDALTLQPSSLVGTSFGADAGLIFSPQFDNFLVRNTVVGINAQNILPRSMRIIDREDTTPRNFRLGLVRSFPMGGAGSAFRLSLELNQSEETSIPMRFFSGFEYNFHGTAMLRGGLYDGQLTYGAGIKVIGLQLDYSYWNGYDTFLGNSHRISAIIHIGKSRDERLAEHRQREMERIEREIRAQLAQARRETINTSMSKARSFVNLGEFERAANEIYKVLSFDESGDDPEFSEARALRDQIERAIEDKRLEQERLARQRDEAESQRRSREQAIRDYHQKALAYYQDEDYPAVIVECERALELDKNRADIQDLKIKAESDLRNKIDRLATQGIELAQQGRTSEAINIFTQAKRLARGNPTAESFIENRIRALEQSLDKDDLVRRALIKEQNKEWSDAAELYRNALQYDPNNNALRKKYQEAFARANARDMEMTPEVLELYSKGSDAFVRGNYQESLRYYEEALRLQPNNRAILRGIDVVRERMQKQQSGRSPSN